MLSKSALIIAPKAFVLILYGGRGFSIITYTLALFHSLSLYPSMYLSILVIVVFIYGSKNRMHSLEISSVLHKRKYAEPKLLHFILIPALAMMCVSNISAILK